MQSDTWNIYTGEQSFVFHFETETGCGSERMRFNARFRDALQVIQVYGMRRHEPQKRGGEAGTRQAAFHAEDRCTSPVARCRSSAQRV